MPYTDWNYSTPNWTNNASPPINQQNLIDMGNALQHMNITPAQLQQLNANPTDTLGTILTSINESGESSTKYDNGFLIVNYRAKEGVYQYFPVCGLGILTRAGNNVYIDASVIIGLQRGLSTTDKIYFTVLIPFDWRPHEEVLQNNVTAAIYTFDGSSYVLVQTNNTVFMDSRNPYTIGDWIHWVPWNLYIDLTRPNISVDNTKTGNVVVRLTGRITHIDFID